MSVQRKGFGELFINKLPYRKGNGSKGALIHPPELLIQGPNHSLYMESQGDLGFAREIHNPKYQLMNYSKSISRPRKSFLSSIPRRLS